MTLTEYKSEATFQADAIYSGRLGTGALVASGKHAQLADPDDWFSFSIRSNSMTYPFAVICVEGTVHSVPSQGAMNTLVALVLDRKNELYQQHAVCVRNINAAADEAAVDTALATYRATS